jgi:hypothetical protein
MCPWIRRHHNGVEDVTRRETDDTVPHHDLDDLANQHARPSACTRPKASLLEMTEVH